MRALCILLTTTAVLASLGCATSQADPLMESWVGKHQSELIREWGPPTESTDDGAGGRILIYESFQRTGGVSDPRRGLTDVKMFYARPDGGIYFWKRCAIQTGPYAYNTCTNYRPSPSTTKKP